jgi:hypothetical protein
MVCAWADSKGHSSARAIAQGNKAREKTDEEEPLDWAGAVPGLTGLNNKL